MATRTVARSLLSRAASVPRTATVLKSLPALATRSFSRSLPARAALQGDSSLASALAEELKFEHDNAAESNAASTEVLAELKSKGWEVKDTAGSDEVVLTKKLDNEVISVTFSVSDLESSEPPMEDEDAAENEMEDEPEENVTVCSISITKPGASDYALVFDAVLEEGAFVIEHVALLPSALGTTVAQSAESDFARRGLYAGPQFEHLDPGVQDHFDAYLTARGLDASLAECIAEFQRVKEQSEYVSWLGGVEAFIKK